MKSIFLILTVAIIGITACDSPQNTTGSDMDSTINSSPNTMGTDTTMGTNPTQPTQPTQPDTSLNR